MEVVYILSHLIPAVFLKVGIIVFDNNKEISNHTHESKLKSRSACTPNLIFISPC